MGLATSPVGRGEALGRDERQQHKGTRLTQYSWRLGRPGAQAGQHVPNVILICFIFYCKRLSDRIMRCWWEAFKEPGQSRAAKPFHLCGAFAPKSLASSQAGGACKGTAQCSSVLY